MLPTCASDAVKARLGLLRLNPLHAGKGRHEPPNHFFFFFAAPGVSATSGQTCMLVASSR